MLEEKVLKIKDMGFLQSPGFLVKGGMGKRPTDNLWIVCEGRKYTVYNGIKGDLDVDDSAFCKVGEESDPYQVFFKAEEYITKGAEGYGLPEAVRAKLNHKGHYDFFFLNMQD